MRFAVLRGARDCVARKLCEDGVGASIKHVEVISSEQESQLWSKRVLGVDFCHMPFKATQEQIKGISWIPLSVLSACFNHIQQQPLVQTGSIRTRENIEWNRITSMNTAPPRGPI